MAADAKSPVVAGPVTPAIPSVDAAANWDVHVGPSRVLFGVDTIDRVGELARDLGGRRVLVVTDPGIRRAGHVDRATAALRAAGCSPTVFDGVEENPTTRHVEAATEFARGEQIDLIVGLGGGSSMDTAKGVNFILTNGGRMSDYHGRGKASKPMLPSIGVPTTAGTGSDAQSYALISDEKTKVKMACGDPKARFGGVILDPALTVTQPPFTTAVTALDAVGHAVETFVTAGRNPVSMLYAREAWRLLSTHVARVLNAPGDLDARAGMLWGAHLAGAAIDSSMLGAAHACANPLTARHGVEHGVAVAIMLPHVVRFNAVEVGTLYDELMSATNEKEGDLAERLELLRNAAGLPARLRDRQVPQEDFEVMAVEAADQWTARHNPRPITAQVAQELYEAAY